MGLKLEHSHLVIHVAIILLARTVAPQICNCPIQETSICNLCSCEMTPENKMAINCKNRGLTQVPTFTQTVTEFHEVNLAENKIIGIPAGKFQQLHSVSQIDLSANSITSIDPLAFDGVGDTLKQLHIEVKSITLFPVNALSSLTNLETLIATGFDLSSTGLPSKSLATMTKLQNLELARNKMSSLQTEAFSGLMSLKSLKLDYNSFSTIPALSQLPTLEYFSILGNTGLTTLGANAFFGITGNLKTIILAQNAFSSMSTDVFNGLSEKLQLLDMRSCQLQDNKLPIIQGLTALQELDLSLNKIANIPTNLFTGMSAMRTLNLHKNEIRTITDQTFMGLSNLKKLDLSNNSLSTVNVNTFYAVATIDDLNLANNPNLARDLPISVFEPIRGNLKTLDLSKTSFTQDHWYLVQNLRQLTELRLTNNQIRNIPDMGIQNLTNLMELYLDSNTLGEMRQQDLYGPNSNLKRLSLNYNSLTTLSKCVFEGFKQVNIHQLGLTGNPLHCDCHLLWLMQELKKHEEYESIWKYIITWTCSSPPALTGKKFASQISEADLVCDPPVTLPPCLDLSPTTTTIMTTMPSTTTTINDNNPFYFSLNITNVTDTTIFMHWKISEVVLGDFYGFRIQYREIDGPERRVDLSLNARKHLLEDLAPSMEYLICVIALGIQQTGNTICDNAHTLPASGESKDHTNNPMMIGLGCALGALVIIAIIIIVVVVKKRQQKKQENEAERFAKSLGVRVGYESKRFSRPNRDTISSVSSQNRDNLAFEHKQEGFSREEQERILRLVSANGASTLSMLSTASNPRYVLDMPAPPRGGRLGSLPAPPAGTMNNGYLNPAEERDDPDKHVYAEIPAEANYNEITDTFI